MDEAYNYVKEVAAEGGDILFVGTKKRLRSPSVTRLCAAVCTMSTLAGWAA